MRTRHLPTLGLLAAMLGACSRPAPPADHHSQGSEAAQLVATFQGEFDPASGSFRIRSLPGASGEGSSRLSLVTHLPWQDGQPASGPDNTLELVTEATPAPGVDPNGCGPGRPSFGGSITVRSFFTSQAFSNVYLQLTQVTPSGYEACNSHPPGSTGLGSTYGLWSYGPLGLKGTPGDHSTVRWEFAFSGGQAFTFQGRILADLLPPAPNPNAAFDWTPALLSGSPGRFLDKPTTLTHLIWNGAGFSDTQGRLTFAPNAAGAPSTSVGLWVPSQARVGPFVGTTFFVADAISGGANGVDTTGDFTACVKFKPGAHPGMNAPTKVLVGLGNAEGAPCAFATDSCGWALMQMHEQYCLHYMSGTDAPNTMSFGYYGAATPSVYDYDYVCGGRNGTFAYVGPHGEGLGLPVWVKAVSPGWAGMPYVIGAYPDGTSPALDEGVFEVIIDNRPFSTDVMGEIVGEAEGRVMPNRALYVPDYVASSSIVGLDGMTYTAPPYAAAPVSTDGSGLLDPGKIVPYRAVLGEVTTTTGFCAGAELQATGSWASVNGGVFDWRAGTVSMAFSAADAITATSGPGSVTSPALSSQLGWVTGSRHTLKMCVAPDGTVSLYGDASLLGTSAAGTVQDLSSPTDLFSIGSGVVPLSGARIARVFACPSSTAANCR